MTSGMSIYHYVCIDSTYNQWRFGGYTIIQTWMFNNNVWKYPKKRYKIKGNSITYLACQYLACQYIKMCVMKVYHIWHVISGMSIYQNVCYESLAKICTIKRKCRSFFVILFPSHWAVLPNFPDKWSRKSKIRLIEDQLRQYT